MINFIVLMIAGGAFITASIGRPSFLAQNSFLDAFVSPEVLGLQAVILTVTLASVANIYISLNRLISTVYSSSEKAAAIATEVKRETKEDCHYIAGSFVATTALLLVKGAIPKEPLIWLSLVNGAVLWFLLLSLLSMLDVYQVAFGVADRDVPDSKD